jgi:hypothetical protein
MDMSVVVIREVVQLLGQMVCRLLGAVSAISSSHSMSFVSELLISSVSAEEPEDVVVQDEGLEMIRVGTHHH